VEDEFDIDLEDGDDDIMAEPDDDADDMSLDADPDLADATEICNGDAEQGQMLLDLIRRLAVPA
jgi:hypothetical protein